MGFRKYHMSGIKSQKGEISCFVSLQIEHAGCDGHYTFLIQISYFYFGNVRFIS